MTWMRLAARAVGAAIGVAGATEIRSAQRRAAAEVAFPPSGQFLEVDGRRLHYEIKGEGPDLVLIHGASGSLRDMTFYLRDRLATRYRVVSVDRPGLGHSDPIADIGLAAQARHLKAGLAPLGLKDPVLVGQSYGGSVALAWALDGGARALVLIGAPSLPWPGKLDLWYRLTATKPGQLLAIPLASAFVTEGYVKKVIARIFAPAPVPEGYVDHIGAALTLRRETLAVNTAQVNALRAELVAMESEYQRLNLPVELIHGSEDTIVPAVLHSIPLSRMLRGARLTLIPGAGHMPHHSHPDLVIEAIDRAALP